MSHTLDQLYEATAENFCFGLGTLRLPETGLAPFIQIHYADWSREKLQVVRQVFGPGLILVSGPPADGTTAFYLRTRGTVILQSGRPGHTEVLRAPAWDARLTPVAHAVAERFTLERKRLGGFLLLLSAPAGEFLTGVDERRPQILTGPVLDRARPLSTDPLAGGGGRPFSHQ